MARTCTICAHDKRGEIEQALVANDSFRAIAERFGTSIGSLHRHKQKHLPALLAQAQQVCDRERATALVVQAQDQQAKEDATAINVMQELRRCFERVNLLFDACDRWLRDPDDPTRYDIGPRAEDVAVIYWEPGPEDKPVRKKAPLSVLMERITSSGRVVDHWESRHADPRELVLKTSERLQSQIELLAKLLGELDERAQVNILIAPEWLTLRTAILKALEPYPEARLALAEAVKNAGE